MNVAEAEKNRRILVIDGDRAVHDQVRRAVIGRIAARGQCGGPLSPSGPPTAFQVDSAFQAEQGRLRVRQALAARRPYALAFLDAHLPSRWDVIETVQRLWKLDPELQAVICTAGPVSPDRLFGELGESDRLLLLKKPLDAIQVRLLAVAMTEKWNAMRRAEAEIRTLEAWVVDAERVLNVLEDSHRALEQAHGAAQNRAAELARLLQKRTAEAVITGDVTVLALAKLAESRDPETGEHLERMQSYTQILAHHLRRADAYADQINERFLENLYRSSPLHDIGKVGIPDAILLKPGPLTPEEFSVMKRHAEIGADALEQVARRSDYAGFLDMAAVIARHHHERFDGSGYPDGLSAGQIPLAARIVALADVFDALTSVRIYKDAVAPDVTRTLIEREAGRHFDPAVVDAFGACYGEFLKVHAGERVQLPARPGEAHAYTIAS